MLIEQAPAHNLSSRKLARLAACRALSRLARGKHKHCRTKFDGTDANSRSIASGLCIDTSPVFSTGFSFGAGMSIALACERPEKFRAAVVYEPGFISGVSGAQCTTPIPFFQSH